MAALKSRLIPERSPSWLVVGAEVVGVNTGAAIPPPVDDDDDEAGSEVIMGAMATGRVCMWCSSRAGWVA